MWKHLELLGKVGPGALAEQDGREVVFLGNGREPGGLEHAALIDAPPLHRVHVCGNQTLDPRHHADPTDHSCPSHAMTNEREEERGNAKHRGHGKRVILRVRENDK